MSILKKPTFILIFVICIIAGAMASLGLPTSLDIQLYYTGDQARALLASFDAHELQAYFYNELIDLLFIVCYSSLFYIGLKKVFPEGRWISFIAFVPGVFDVIENSFIIYALKTSEPHLFLNWLGVITCLKWTLGTCVVLTLAWQALRGGRRPRNLKGRP